MGALLHGSKCHALDIWIARAQDGHQSEISQRRLWRFLDEISILIACISQYSCHKCTPQQISGEKRCWICYYWAYPISVMST